jgi:hypothetical protein
VFRARWDVLEPLFTEVKFRAPSKERRAAIVETIIAAYDQMSRNSQQQGLSLSKFYSVFDRSLRVRLDELMAEYADAMQAFKVLPTEDNQTVVIGIERLLINNAHWLQLYAEQFAIFVNDMKGNDASLEARQPRGGVGTS